MNETGLLARISFFCGVNAIFYENTRDEKTREWERMDKTLYDMEYRAWETV